MNGIPEGRLKQWRDVVKPATTAVALGSDILGEWNSSSRSTTRTGAVFSRVRLGTQFSLRVRRGDISSDRLIHALEHLGWSRSRHTRAAKVGTLHGILAEVAERRGMTMVALIAL